MKIVKVGIDRIDSISPLISKFRVELKGCKGIKSDENIDSAKEEFEAYISSDFPIFACFDNEYA